MKNRKAYDHLGIKPSMRVSTYELIKAFEIPEIDFL